MKTSSCLHHGRTRKPSTTAILVSCLVFMLDVAHPVVALDMANWMLALDGDTTRLQDVVLPGSHDAGAYQIYNPPAFSGEQVQTCGTVDLGDLPQWLLNQLVNLEEANDGNAVNLVETQRVSINEQLLLGIRYMDVRVGRHTDVNGIEELRLHHTLFMDVTLQDAFAQVASFLSSHSTEVVVLKLKLQCGTTFDQVQALISRELQNGNDELFGGPLTPAVLSSALSQIQGRAFVIWDYTDPDTAVALASSNLGATAASSVLPESYYRINPCKADDPNDNKGWWGWWDDLIGGDTDDQCWSWPDYTYDQGQWLTDQIVQDLSSNSDNVNNNPLPLWQETPTNEETFRVLSFLGVLPMGNGCDPTNQGYLITAVLSCDRISIDSYTETFQAQFGTLMEMLQQNNMGAGAVNAIQVDYVDGYPLEDMVVQLNKPFFRL